MYNSLFLIYVDATSSFLSISSTLSSSGNSLFINSIYAKRDRKYSGHKLCDKVEK